MASSNLEENNIVILWAVLHNERSLIHNQELFNKIQSDIMQKEKLLVDAFETTYDWLNNIKSDIFTLNP